MTKTLKLFCFTLVLFLSSALYSQTNSANETNIAEYKQLQSSLDGYYQIQIVNSRAKPTVSFDLLKEIKAKREETQDSFIQVRPDIKVLVLGKNEPAQFADPKDRIVYIRD